MGIHRGSATLRALRRAHVLRGGPAVHQLLGLRHLQTQSLTEAFSTLSLCDNHSYLGYGRLNKRSIVFYQSHKSDGDEPSRVPQGATTARRFHIRLLLDVMTGAQSGIQSDKLPVAGIEPRLPSRTSPDVWPVGPDHLHQLA